MILKLARLNIGKYFIVSCTAAIIDMLISLLLYKYINLDYLLASNIGIVSGFLFQYFISIKYVFKSKNTAYSLIVYIASFLIGTLAANGTMLVSFDIFKSSFLLSKLLSMAVPFFVMYYIRRLLLGVKSIPNSL